MHPEGKSGTRKPVDQNVKPDTSTQRGSGTTGAKNTRAQETREPEDKQVAADTSTAGLAR